MPKISDILAHRAGYKFLTKLDLSMQYYTFKLDDNSKELCTMQLRLVSTAIAVSQWVSLSHPTLLKKQWNASLRPLQILKSISTTWPSSVTRGMIISTSLIMSSLSLKHAGFMVNPLKCEWAVQETDFLGHWLTPSGMKPWHKKVDAILKMQAPTTLKELCSFLGLVNYYRDMWPHRSHILAPLTALTGKKAFVWNPTCQSSFEQMKKLTACDALLAYPDHNLPFSIETDASDYQLGAVIKQNDHPIAYYSRKLNSTQKNYTTIEKELLSIVETLRQFCTMLLGARITIHTRPS